MKSLVIALLLLFSTTAHAQTSKTPTQTYQTAPAPEESLLDNKLYFFAHSMCQNCRTAFIYLNEHHADLNIEITDMKFHHNLELYKQCVKKFNIPNKELRLPLLCIGNNYIMGWDETSEAHFEKYLKEFQATAH